MGVMQRRCPRELLDIGDEMCHIDHHGIMFIVFGRKTAMNAINTKITRFSSSQPSACFHLRDAVETVNSSRTTNTRAFGTDLPKP
jgi:hypothetical protein